MERVLFEDPRVIKTQIKFVLTCTALTMGPSRDGGTWRRLRVVNFGSKFINEPVADNEFKIDTRLKEKIKEWGPYFLAYLIHIYNSVYKKSSYLVAPEAIIASTNSYQADNDYFLDYFDTRIEMNDDPKSIISKTAAVADFKAWFKQVHEGNKLPRNDLLGKFLDEQLGKQSTKGWKKVAFRNDIVDSTNDEEEEKNDLDI